MAATLTLLDLGACRASAVRDPVERAPYETADGGLLRVREDLAGAIRSVTVGAGAEAAQLLGHGRLAFAPGGSYAVRVPLDGFVQRVHVQVGDAVRAGSLLATLRSSEAARLRADLRRLTATLATERDALARTERLVSENAASVRDVVETRGRIAALEAERSGVREALLAARVEAVGTDVVQLRAERAGDVLVRNVEPGERVLLGADEPAFLVGDPAALVVTADLPERDAPLLRTGAACEFVVPSLGSRRFQGSVGAVVRAIDPQTHTARVTCRPATPDPQLRAEMLARVQISARVDATPIVPRAAVLLHRDARIVLVRRGPGLLERRSISTGLEIADGVQVLAGVAPGEQVVTDGAVLLDGEFDQLL